VLPLILYLEFLDHGWLPSWKLRMEPHRKDGEGMQGCRQRNIGGEG
jgi:hypothetical protein